MPSQPVGGVFGAAAASDLLMELKGTANRQDQTNEAREEQGEANLLDVPPSVFRIEARGGGQYVPIFGHQYDEQDRVGAEQKRGRHQGAYNAWQARPFDFH